MKGMKGRGAMLYRSADLQQRSLPVNTWPWRGWQVWGGSCGLKGG
jgi:hypothetical protein